ncbi:sensor domain-containing diguanylate cyclase [Shewanella sp. A25]|nr:sensor domain-containing diguanylate cyclase [Shewanella shenzhenensis]
MKSSHLGSIFRPRIGFWFLTMVYLVVSMLILGLMTSLYSERHRAIATDIMRNQIALIRSEIEASIVIDTYLADSLATVVTINPDFAIENWEMIATKLVDKAHYVRNVGIAPNDVISHVYPLQGNEKAVGFDVKTNPVQRRSIELAKQLGGVYIAGPLTLVQGGLGLIARYPIYSDYPLNQVYWGSVSIVIDSNKLLMNSGITHVQDANISIRKVNKDGIGDSIVYGSDSVFEEPDIELPINVPNGQWTLAAKYHLKDDQLITLAKVIIYSIGGFSAIFTYFLIVLLYRNYHLAHKASLRDELTQLSNRRCLMNQLQELLQRADNPMFALLNIDLNGFKGVNDELGHAAGDELLKHVANLLVDNVRNSDTVARIGGDEFIVILRNLDSPKHIQAMVDKIQTAVKSHPLIWQQQPLRASLSIGFAVYDGTQTSINELLQQADTQMYQAKAEAKRTET